MPEKDSDMSGCLEQFKLLAALTVVSVLVGLLGILRPLPFHLLWNYLLVIGTLAVVAFLYFKYGRNTICLIMYRKSSSVTR